MKIKQGVQISTSEFWYDLTNGGYIRPMEICENQEDAAQVIAAINVLEDFQSSCEEQIDGFIQ